MAQNTVSDLYELDPKDFVAGRDQLARDLRADGDKDGAKAVKGLRRPSIPIWALNQVARQQPDVVEALVQASDDAHGGHGPAGQGRSRRSTRAPPSSRPGRAPTSSRRRGGSADQYELEITSVLEHGPRSRRTRADLRDGVLNEVDDDDAGMEWPEGARRDPPRPTRRRTDRNRESRNRSGAGMPSPLRRSSRRPRPPAREAEPVPTVLVTQPAARRHAAHAEPAREAQRDERGVDRGPARRARRRSRATAAAAPSCSPARAAVLRGTRPHRLRHGAGRRRPRPGPGRASRRRPTSPRSSRTCGRCRCRSSPRSTARPPAAGWRSRSAATSGSPGASARFNVAFVRVGLSGCDIGVSWLLPRLIGAQPRVGADAHRTHHRCARSRSHRLVTRVVPDDELIDSALETAALIVANSPWGVRMTKEVGWSQLEVGSLQAGIDLENRTQILSSFTGDHREAVAAFFERRPTVLGG